MLSTLLFWREWDESRIPVYGTNGVWTLKVTCPVRLLTKAFVFAFVVMFAGLHNGSATLPIPVEVSEPTKPGVKLAAFTPARTIKPAPIPLPRPKDFAKKEMEKLERLYEKDIHAVAKTLYHEASVFLDKNEDALKCVFGVLKFRTKDPRWKYNEIWAAAYSKRPKKKGGWQKLHEFSYLDNPSKRLIPTNDYYRKIEKMASEFVIASHLGLWKNPCPGAHSFHDHRVKKPEEHPYFGRLKQAYQFRVITSKGPMALFFYTD